jgi:hypothetical protein
MKMLKGIILAVAMLVLTASSVCGADGQTITRKSSDTGDLNVLYVDWVAAAGGTKAAITVPQVNSYLFMVITKPDGVTPPAANYEIILTDESGNNLLLLAPAANPMADLSATATEEFLPFLGGVAYGGRLVDGNMTITFADVTNANAEGRITFYFISP